MRSEAYHAQPDEAFNATPEPLAEDFRFVTTQPPPDADFIKPGPRRRGRPFVKGQDARRHVHSATCGHALYVFTAAQRSAGFYAALASYAEKGGDPRNFLRRKMAQRGQVFSPTPKARRGLRAAA